MPEPRLWSRPQFSQGKSSAPDRANEARPRKKTKLTAIPEFPVPNPQDSLINGRPYERINQP